MIWALLALLGVPIWLVLGGLAGAFWSRHEFRKQAGVFAAKLRLESGAFPGFSDDWRRTSSYCVWAHRVLLVYKGLALIRVTPVPVESAVGVAEPGDTGNVKRMGDDPVVMRFRLDDGSILALCAPNDAASLLAGPFSAAAQDAA